MTAGFFFYTLCFLFLVSSLSHFSRTEFEMFMLEKQKQKKKYFFDVVHEISLFMAEMINNRIAFFYVT